MKHIHFLGIGGSGASAVAAIAKTQGFEVTGCDIEPFNEFTKNFSKDLLKKGHSTNHLEGVDILTYSPAALSFNPDNPEYLEAKKRNLEILSWQEFMGQYLEKDKFVIAVCGTHGKTTTTAMIAQILEDAGLDPTAELGALVPRWDKNYRVGKGQYFITEADEFHDNFLASQPNITVVTTIEMDHPEYFKDFESYKKSFKKFLGQTKDIIIANLSDGGVTDVLAFQGETLEAQIINYSKKLIDFPLQIPGKFNIFNATAAYQVGLSLGIDPEVIRKSLSNFTGAGRRMEEIGEYNGAEIYSDFGHHPTEIKKTMEAIREKYPDKRILLIYQPHMFSRTKALFNDFVKVFQNLPVDKTYIIDIYPSREIDTGEVSSNQLVEVINKNSVEYIGTADKTLDKIKPEIESGDIVFFMSAGDTDKIARELVKL